MRWALIFVALVAVLGATGCASVSRDLERATQHYEQARYEAVVSWLADLEPELPTMKIDQRARFLYLRGMASYRLGQREDAIHYLAMAREVVVLEPRSLPPSLRSTLDRAIAVLVPNTTAAGTTFGAAP